MGLKQVKGLPYHLSKDPNSFTKPTGSPLLKDNPVTAPELSPLPFEPKVLTGDNNDNIEIYRSMNQNNGGWIPSSLEGAPNSSQLGVRTPMSSPNPDIIPSPIGNQVGPSFTGNQGLSGNVLPPINDKRPTGMITPKQLPLGLKAVQDNPNHVSIVPSINMDFKTYQSLLNSIPWQRIK